MARSVSIVGVAQLPHAFANHADDEASLVQQVTHLALEDAGLGRKDVGFTCSGSCDYVMGRPFSFVLALDGLGAWPPIRESHVEMDGAWALYEAWVRLQHGDVDIALAYGFGKSSIGAIDPVYTAQLDPYYQAPMGPRPIDMAALQARALLDAGLATEEDFAAVVEAARRASLRNPFVPDAPQMSLEALLAAPSVASPLRAHDAAIRTDGAAAVVLQVDGEGPRIAGMSHCIDAHGLGHRPLTESVSTMRAAQAAGVRGGVDVAELHLAFSSQQTVLASALRLDRHTRINPTGGSLVADTPMVAGISRFVEAVGQLRAGAERAIAHATSGPCLQHNLVALLEAP